VKKACPGKGQSLISSIISSEVRNLREGRREAGESEEAEWDREGKSPKRDCKSFERKIKSDTREVRERKREISEKAIKREKYQCENFWNCVGREE
jgi:hypothetical protein